MKIYNSMKCMAALLGSLTIATVQADAKPGNGKSSGKGMGGSHHSQKAHKEKRANHSEKRDHQSDKKNDRKQQHSRFKRFEDKERNEIVEYFGRYRTQGEGLPPGLAMNSQRGKPLPPGWQKKLVPGYRINDSDWSRYAPVPSNWFPNLRMEPNTRLYHYGDRVVRVYEPRREVIDVISLPFRR